VGRDRPAASPLIMIPAFSPDRSTMCPKTALQQWLDHKRRVCYSCQCFLPPCTRMSSGSFWSDVCAHARGKPLQTLLISAYASCSVTVRQLCCCC
jgi:hypothetical protein